MTPGYIAAFSLGPIGSASIGFITIPLLAKYFPADVIGRGALLQTGISFCLLLFGLGLDQAYIREFHESKNKAGLFKITILPGLFLLLLSIVVAFLFRPIVISELLFGIKDVTYSLMASLCFLGAFLMRYFSLILQLQGRGLSFSFIQILPKLIFLAVISFYVFRVEHLGLDQLLATHVISLVGVAIVCAWMTRLGWLVKSKPLESSQFTKQLSFGLPLILSGFFYWAITSLDKFSLRYFASFHELGLYVIANSIAGVAIGAIGIFQTVFTPTAYKWHIDGLEAASIHRMTNHLLVVVVGFVILAGLFSWCVVLILPDEYHNSQFIIPACLLGPLFFTLSEASSIGLGIVRKNYLVVISIMVALAVSALANLLLVPLFGASGAASSTSIAFFSLLILRTEFASRHWELVPRRSLYGFSLAITFMSVAYALWGAYQPLFFIALWGLLLLVACISFRVELSNIVVWIHQAIK